MHILLRRGWNARPEVLPNKLKLPSLNANESNKSDSKQD